MSAGLLGLWTYNHPTVLENWQKPYLADVAQAYTLANVLFDALMNYFVIGPLTSK
jgi:hypothetical protein